MNAFTFYNGKDHLCLYICSEQSGPIQQRGHTAWLKTLGIEIESRPDIALEGVTNNAFSTLTIFLIQWNAANLIRRRFRYYQRRKAEKYQAAIRIQIWVRRFLHRKAEKRAQAAIRIQIYVRRFLQRIAEKRAQAAIRIQIYVRRFLQRKAEKRAAIRIQIYVRRFLQRKAEKRAQAAIRIQICVRRFLQRKAEQRVHPATKIWAEFKRTIFNYYF